MTFFRSLGAMFGPFLRERVMGMEVLDACRRQDDGDSDEWDNDLIHSEEKM